jgi:hypothetical protein
VFLDASSTVSHITKYISAEQNLTVITNSTLVAEKLKEKHILCYLTGGRPVENSYALVGNIAEQALLGLYANICFFSTLDASKRSFKKFVSAIVYQFHFINLYHLTDFVFHISSAYSLIALSAENTPAFAMFISDILLNFSRSE